MEVEQTFSFFLDTTAIIGTNVSIYYIILLCYNIYYFDYKIFFTCFRTSYNQNPQYEDKFI